MRQRRFGVALGFAVCGVAINAGVEAVGGRGWNDPRHEVFDYVRGRATNVIFFVGDGMGLSTVTATCTRWASAAS